MLEWDGVTRTIGEVQSISLSRWPVTGKNDACGLNEQIASALGEILEEGFECPCWCC